MTQLLDYWWILLVLVVLLVLVFVVKRMFAGPDQGLSLHDTDDDMLDDGSHYRAPLSASTQSVAPPVFAEKKSEASRTRYKKRQKRFDDVEELEVEDVPEPVEADEVFSENTPMSQFEPDVTSGFYSNSSPKEDYESSVRENSQYSAPSGHSERDWTSPQESPSNHSSSNDYGSSGTTDSGPSSSNSGSSSSSD